MTPNDFRHAPLVAALCLAACAGGGETGGGGAPPRRAEGGEGDVVVVAAWPWAARGQLLFGKGVDLAVDEVNAAGGIRGRRLRVERADDEESVDQGRLIAEQLARRKDVAAVIGHMQSFVTMPAASIYDAAGVVLLAPAATAPALTAQGYRRVFRLMFDDEDTGRYMATVAHESRRSHVGVYYIRNGYGRALANAFEEHAAALGMQVVDRRSYDPSGPQEDLSGIVREWKQRDVDGVFIAGEAREAAEFARALRAGGLVVPLFGGDALGVPELLRAGGHDVDGMLIPAPFHVDDDRAEVRAFVAAFRARYGAAPDALAALGYDAVRAVAGALRRRADGTPAALAAALRDSAGGAGVTGTLSFDDAGDRRQVHMVTLGVQGGAFELVVPSARVVARR